MRLLLINHVQNAMQSLGSTRMRTALTILGVTVGVASITFLMSLGGGAVRVVEKQVSSLDGNIAIIRPAGMATPSTSLKSLTTPVGSMSYAASPLTEQDVASLRELDEVSAVSPLMSLTARMSVNGESELRGRSVLATNPALVDVSNLKIYDGQFLDDVTSKNTAVIGKQLSIDLFGTEHSIGKIFSIRDQRFRVIGTIDTTNPINYNNVDFDSTAIISLDAGKEFNQGVAQIQQINIQASSASQLDDAIEKAHESLLGNHKNEKDFTILSGDDIARPSNELFQAVTGINVIIASISLVVGGIGIMNIMLVNVAERTREIGIRKSLGASNTHITWQFLIESLAMSISGGVGGYILGYISAFLVSSFLPFDPVFSWVILGVSLGVSIVVGTIFGLYPALRAANKNPIESLRQAQ